MTARRDRESQCQEQCRCVGAYSLVYPRLQSFVALILRLGHHRNCLLAAVVSSVGNALRNCSALNALQQDEVPLCCGCVICDVWMSKNENNDYPVVQNLKPRWFSTIVKCCRQESSIHLTCVHVDISREF